MKQECAGDPGTLNGKENRIAGPRVPPGLVENIRGLSVLAIDGDNAVAGLEPGALRRTIRVNADDLLAMLNKCGFRLVANLHARLLMADRIHPKSAVERGRRGKKHGRTGENRTRE